MKLKKIIPSIKLLVLFILLSCTFSFAQTIDTTATFFCGGTGFSVKDMATDDDGNTYTCGVFFSPMEFPDGSSLDTDNSSYNDAFIVKHDSEGNLVWKKNWSSTSSQGASFHQIETDSSGNIYVSGYGSPINGEQISIGIYGYYILKLDSNGNIIWLNSTPNRAYISIENTEKISFAFEWMDDGNLCGMYMNYSWLGGKLVYGVIDLNGNLLWHHVDNNNINLTYVYSPNNLVNGVFAKNNKFLIHGVFDNTLGFPGNTISASGEESYYAIIDINTQSVEHAEVITGTDVSIQDMELDNNGKVFFGVNHTNSFNISGQSVGSSTFENAMVGSLDSLYQIDWIHDLGGTNGVQQGDIFLSSICLSENNHMIINGDYLGVVDFDGISLTADPIFSANNSSYISVLDESGDMSWVLNIGGDYSDHALLIQSVGNKLFIEGKYSDNIIWNGYPLPFGGNTSIYLTTIIDSNISIPQDVNLGNDTIICPYDTLLLDVSSSSSTYLWHDGSTDPILAVTEPGIYWVTRTNNYGTSTDSINVTSSNIISDFSFSNNGNGSYSFTNTSVGNFNQSHWAFGDGITSTVTNPNHTFDVNGAFPIVLNVNDSLLGASCLVYSIDTILITDVQNPLDCSAGFVIYPDTTYNNITIMNTSTGNNLNYFWDFGDGNTSTQQFPSHTYSTTGPFSICLTVDDGTGCLDSYCDSIGVNGIIFHMTGGFTINVTPSPSLGIQSGTLLESTFKIYPNPTTDQLYVVTTLKNLDKIEVLDVTGKSIKTNNKKTNIINVNNLPSGVYLIKVTTSENTLIKRFVKK